MMTFRSQKTSKLNGIGGSMTTSTPETMTPTRIDPHNHLHGIPIPTCHRIWPRRWKSAGFSALLFALPLAAQIHIEACSPTDAGYSLPSTCYTSPVALPMGSPGYLQKERYGTFSYHFAVADGQYAVGLHFIENSTAISAGGQRVFSVGINGAPVIVGLDLFATAGFNAGVDKSFSTSTSGGTGITIAFTTILRNAVISAIDITPVPIAPPPSFPGCSPDGQQGIQCAGGFTATAPNISGSVNFRGADSGGIGITAANAAGNLIMLVMPTGDPTTWPGKFLQVGAPVPCPKMAAELVKANPICLPIVLAVP